MGKKYNPQLQNLNWKQSMALQQQSEAMKPFLLNVMENLANQSHAKLSQQQLATSADVLTSIRTLKDLLIDKGLFTSAEYDNKRYTIEDDSYGVTVTSDGAVNGDYVRVIYKAKEASAGGFGGEKRQALSKLGQGQLPPEVEAAIVGMKSGESTTVDFSITNKMPNVDSAELVDVTHNFSMELTVIRVSKYPAPVAPEAETPTKEPSNG